VSGLDSYATRRVLAGIVALPMTVFALLTIMSQMEHGLDPIGAVIASTSATIAILCGWFALRGHVAESRAEMGYAWLGGFLLGGIGFVAGFFGPIILTPGANQGPLLGIFITGPLGFSLGALIGWFCARFRRRAAGAG
jgi:hypothetical protein